MRPHFDEQTFIDFSKSLAKHIKKDLREQGVSLGHSKILELIAQSSGFNDWNTLVAAEEENQEIWVFRVTSENEQGGNLQEVHILIPCAPDEDVLKAFFSIASSKEFRAEFASVQRLTVEEFHRVKSISNGEACGLRGDDASLRNARRPSLFFRREAHSPDSPKGSIFTDIDGLEKSIEIREKFRKIMDEHDALHPVNRVNTP